MLLYTFYPTIEKCYENVMCLLGTSLKYRRSQSTVSPEHSVPRAQAFWEHRRFKSTNALRTLWSTFRSIVQCSLTGKQTMDDWIQSIYRPNVVCLSRSLMTHYYSEYSNNFGISGTRILTEKDTASLKVKCICFCFVPFRYKQREN